MSAEFGAIETVMSLFLAGMFGVTGYMIGYSISLKGSPVILLCVVLASVAVWALVVFGLDYPHVLAARKAALVANATLWPLALGGVFGFLLSQRQDGERKAGDRFS